MGGVHFLHGILKSLGLKEEDQVRVICPNENCHQPITGFITQGTKKVCPHCKKPLPPDVIRALQQQRQR